LSDFNPIFLDEGEWAPLDPKPADARESFTIAAGSITNEQLAGSISPTKIQGVGAKVYGNGAQSTADGVAEFLAPDGIAFDEGDFWSSGDQTKLTAPYSGVYFFTGYAEFAADADGQRRGSLYINGAQDVTVNVPSAGAAFPTQVLVSTPLYLAAGSYVQFEVFQSAGGALNVNAGEANNFISLILLFSL
jgi:hypothetical protein